MRKFIKFNIDKTLFLLWLAFVEVWSCLALQEVGQVLAPIIQSFYGIMKCVSTSLVAVTQLVESMKSFHELFQLCWSDEFLQAFERYKVMFLHIKVAKHCLPLKHCLDFVKPAKILDCNLILQGEVDANSSVYWP